MGRDSEPDDSTDPDTEALAEAVVAELDTGTVVDDKIVVSRRGLTALIGAGLGAGALSMLGVDKATAQTATGKVGTQQDRVDVFAGQVDADSLSTESVNTVRTIKDGETIESVIDSFAEPTNYGAQRGRFELVDKNDPWDQQVTIDEQGVRFEAEDHNVKLTSTGSPATLEVQGADCTIQHIWVDNSGSNNALNIGREATVTDIDVDQAAVGMYINGMNAKISECEFLTGGITNQAIRLSADADQTNVSDCIIDVGTSGNSVANAIGAVRSGGNRPLRCSFSNIEINGTTDAAIFWDGGQSTFSGITIDNSDGRGVLFRSGASYNFFSGVIRNTTGLAADIRSNNNTLMGTFDGDVEISGNDNTIIGTITGSVTDNGTGNTIN